MSRIQQILSSTVRRLLRCSSRIRQSSSILHTPTELMQIIFDLLSLPARVALSQTCKCLHGNYGSQCHAEVRKLGAEERIHFLEELSNLLPEFRVCYFCSALHIIDTKDTPINPSVGVYYSSPSCPIQEPVWIRHHLNSWYAVAIRHVQLAIKYTRLKDVHEKYCASVLATYKVNHTDFYSTHLTFIAKPKVIQGRFFLKTTWQFSGKAASLSPNLIGRAPFGICPHLGNCPISYLWDDPLFVAISELYDLLQNDPDSSTDGSCASGKGSCIKCPTDYIVDVTKGGKEVFIHVWQDLGTGTSLDDPYWKSHLWDVKHNSHYRGEAFDYEHGSIRRALTNDSAH